MHGRTMRAFAFPTVLALSIVACTTTFAQTTNDHGWTSIGLGAGGALYDPAASPHDPKLMFVSSDMSGFYRSEDGGRTWEMLDWRMIRRSRAPVFHPTDPNVIYAVSHNGRALRVSRDKGKTWKIETGPWRGDAGLRALAIDPDKPRYMLLSSNKGVVYSDPRTSNFWFLARGDTPKDLIAFHIDRTSPKDKRTVFAANAGGVYRSDDGGKTWVEKSKGLPWRDIRAFCGGSDAKTGRCVLFCIIPSKTVGGRFEGGVYRSTDRGETWESAMGEGINKQKNDQYLFLAQALNDPDVIYAADHGSGGGKQSYTVYRSDDAGKTWRFSMMSDPNFDYNNTEVGWLYWQAGRGWGEYAMGFGVNEGKSDQVFYTNFGEIFTSDDGAKTWRQIYSRRAEGQGAPRRGQRWSGIGLEDTSVWQYVFDPHEPNRHYICYTDIGFARSEDSGKSWYNMMPALPWRNTTYRMACDPDVAGRIWAAQSNMHDIPNWSGLQGHRNRPGGIAVSRDFGKTWQKSNAGLPRAPATDVIIDPKSPKDARTLYACIYGYGVYKSTDGGKSWKSATEGIVPANNRQVYRIQVLADGTLLCSVAGRRPGEGVANYTTGGLYRSTDGAKSWTRISSDDIFRPVDFAVKPDDPNTIYVAAMDGMAHKGGVYKTVDGGKTWTRSVPDYDKDVLNYIEGFSVALNPRDPNIVYFLTMTHGMFISRDAGKTWEATTPDNSPPFCACSRIVWDPKDAKTVVIVTFGGGVWRGPDPAFVPKKN